MPQSVAAAELNHRDGFAELNMADQPNMARRAALFQGVKLGAEYAGMRPLRHTLHLDLSTAPPGAKLSSSAGAAAVMPRLSLCSSAMRRRAPSGSPIMASMMRCLQASV